LTGLVDVQKTKEKFGSTFAANVTGINLSTLVQRTMAPFQPESKKSRGGHIIVKMDVEGAEYGVIKELARSGILCEYIAKGNKVIMLVEFHTARVIEKKELIKVKAGSKKAIATLKACGVVFEGMLPGWA